MLRATPRRYLCANAKKQGGVQMGTCVCVRMYATIIYIDIYIKYTYIWGGQPGQNMSMLVANKKYVTCTCECLHSWGGSMHTSPRARTCAKVPLHLHENVVVFFVQLRRRVMCSRRRRQMATVAPILLQQVRLCVFPLDVLLA